jgi:hypothetical protein
MAKRLVLGNTGGDFTGLLADKKHVFWQLGNCTFALFCRYILSRAQSLQLFILTFVQ